MKSRRQRLVRSLCIFVSALFAGFSFSVFAATNLSVWVFPGASGRLISQPNSTGDRLLDYSGIGYGGGKIPLPSTNIVPVKIVVQPVAGDNVSNIQAAINFVSGLPMDTNGFRGAVYLSNGVYNVGSQIKISKSGVVLRGAGSFTNGSGTVLYATATNSQGVLLEVTGSGSASTISGTTHNITNNYVPVGARSFWVNSASGLSVGQNVYVERIATSNWIHDLGMDLLGPPPDVPWTPSGYNINMECTITHIEGNHIFVDSPITCAIDAVRYTNGTIRAFTWTSRITNCGVEHIFAQSWYGGNVTNESHQNSFIQFDNVVNGWVRDVADQYFVVYCVSVNDNNRFVTVQDSRSYDPISIITGGRRYAFNINSSGNILFKNCYTREDRHQFVTESVNIGSDAFVDGLSDSAHAEAGPHQRWSSGVLWDNITVHGGNNDIQNAGNFGTGHGWEAANSVIWNNTANGFIVQNPPFAQNWLIGSIGPIQTGTAWNIGYTNMPHANGNYDSSGSSAQNVFPDSLFFNQQQDRLAAPNLQSRDYWLGGFGQFTNNSPGGVGVALDSTWSNAVKNISGGQRLDNFDIVTNNHWVPFTFNFNVSSNEHVVAATLALSMKATNSASSDVLYLDATNNAFTFSQLNWLPIATGTNITVRVLDLANQLNFLTNGQFNVAVQGDIGIDWAMLELQVAPNAAVTQNILTPVADATVRGGTSAGNNFGTATTLTVRQDSSANNIQQAYLKWDLSGVSGRISQARIVLTPVSVGTNNIEQGVMVTASNNWTENGINFNNQPNGVERFVTWIPSTNGTVSFDVTPQVLDAMQNDKQLSLELFSVSTNSVDYASRENSNAGARPQLIISTPGLGPMISGIGDQNILPNGVAGPIAFTIGGSATNSATLSGDSSNPNLLPDSNIVFGGSGTNRTVTLTPLANQNGAAVVTVTVTDGSGNSASTSFNLTVSSHSPTSLIWNGPGNGANNWTNVNNWSPTFAPEYADNVKFFNAGASGIAISNLNNFIAFDTAIASLQFGNTNGNHTTLIGDGNTLTISGGLTAGTETDNGNGQVVSATVTGNGGTLNLTGGSLIVRQGSTTSGGAPRATLDLSGLGELDATMSQISVGIAGVNRPAGILYLARTNNITLSGSPGIFAADSGSNGGQPSFIYLGINNQIFADSMTIGSQKSTASLAFAPYFTNQNPSLYLRSQTGDRMTQWLVGDNSKQSTSGSGCSGVIDFSGGTVDAQVDTIYLGKGQTSNGIGTAAGTLTLNAGMLDANTIEAGYENSSTAGAVVTGTVNVNGSATLLINSTLRLAREINTSSNFPVGNLNVNGGTVSGAGNIVAGGGTSSVNASNGTFAVASIGSLAAPLTKLALTNSILQLSVAVSTTNCVTTNLICGGSSNVISIISLPGGAAQYPLIRYSGAIGGAGFNFVLGAVPAGALGYLSNDVVNASVDLVITNYIVPDSFLTWDGDFSGDWDFETANWKNNVFDDLNYLDGNDVVFNDSATGATNVNLTDALAPNSVTVSNSVKNFILQGDGNLTGSMALVKSGSGTLTIANTGSNDFSGGVTIASGTLIVGDGTVNGNLPVVGNISDNGALVFNRSNNVVVPNTISGFGSVSQIGSGVLNLTAANTFTGGVTISNGTVLVGNSSALGATNDSVAITNAGTLDVNGISLTGYPVIVSGFGANSNGAIVNNGLQQTSALRNVTLAGNATFGGTSRWDIRNTGGTASLSSGGHAYKITKVGTNQISLVGVNPIDSALGDIDIQQGEFAVQTSTVQLGDSSKTITVHSNATLEVWGLTAGPLNKAIVLQDGSTFFSETGTSTNAGTILLQGNATFNIGGTTLKCTNVISGAGGFVKIGSSPLILSASNIYAGSTFINSGTLTLTGVGTIGGSTNICIANGAFLDVSTRNNTTLTLNGQTLNGNGTLNGNLTVNSGATVSPGTNSISTGLLVITNAVTLNGTTLMKLNKTLATNDVLQVGGNLNYGGMLALTNLNGTLTTNDSFKLFSAGGYSGAFTNFVPAVPRAGLKWDTSSLAGNGILKIATAPRPAIANISVSGTKLIFTGVNGQANETYWLLASTNLNLPLASWPVVTTNTFDSNGQFSLTNPIAGSASQTFYLLLLP